MTISLNSADIEIKELQYVINDNIYYDFDDVPNDDDMYTFGKPFRVQEQSPLVAIAALLLIGFVMYGMVQYAKITSLSNRVESKSDQYVTIEMYDREFDRRYEALSTVSISYQQQMFDPN